MSKHDLERRSPATRTDRIPDPGKHRPRLVAPTIEKACMLPRLNIGYLVSSGDLCRSDPHFRVACARSANGRSPLPIIIERYTITGRGVSREGRIARGVLYKAVGDRAAPAVSHESMNFHSSDFERPKRRRVNCFLLQYMPERPDPIRPPMREKNITSALVRHGTALLSWLIRVISRFPYLYLKAAVNGKSDPIAAPLMLYDSS
ncbi:hypothetical protein EDB84DRAFT_1438075 [Lactarius hengduanensis]|nr:hypothetical protein EDB84DRAFT_1438075 [Lactarius hengduanensis]